MTIYNGSANERTVTQLSDSEWYSFENKTAVRVRDDMDDGHCSWVQVVDSPKAFGWVATALLLKPTPRRLAILAAEKERRAREATRAQYLRTLPTIENGNSMVFLGSDRKCSEQFVQALSMDGLEKRKKMADLVTYGCGYLEDRGTHVKRISADASYCQVTPADGKHDGKPGWVPCSWVH